jgi:hypothetical protein
MQTVMDNVDQDSPLLKKFRERETFSATDFSEASQYLFLVTGGVEPENDFDLPFQMIARFAEGLEADAWIRRFNDERTGLKYQAESWHDHEIHVGRHEPRENVVVMGPTPACYFPGNGIVAMAPERVLHAMIDGLDEDSPGQELAGNLNSGAELHLLIDEGSRIVQSPFFKMMLEGLSNELTLPGGVTLMGVLEDLRRLEMVFDSGQMVPLQATIEMKTDAAAENIEQLIQTGLQAAPALLMMAEAELNAQADRDQEEIRSILGDFRSMIELGKRSVKEIQVERDGDRLEIRLSNVEGLEKFPQQVVNYVAWQMMMFEKMAAAFERFEDDEAVIEDQNIVDQPKAEKKKDDDGR